MRLRACKNSDVGTCSGGIRGQSFANERTQVSCEFFSIVCTMANVYLGCAHLSVKCFCGPGIGSKSNFAIAGEKSWEVDGFSYMFTLHVCRITDEVPIRVQKAQLAFTGLIYL